MFCNEIATKLNDIHRSCLQILRKWCRNSGGCGYLCVRYMFMPNTCMYIYACMCISSMPCSRQQTLVYPDSTLRIILFHPTANHFVHHPSNHFTILPMLPDLSMLAFSSPLTILSAAFCAAHSCQPLTHTVSIPPMNMTIPNSVQQPPICVFETQSPVTATHSHYVSGIIQNTLVYHFQIHTSGALYTTRRPVCFSQCKTTFSLRAHLKTLVSPILRPTCASPPTPISEFFFFFTLRKKYLSQTVYFHNFFFLFVVM